MTDADHRFIMTDGASEMCADACPNGLFGSHKFEPRYDLGPADLSAFVEFKGTFKGTPSLLESMRKKTYVRDVCVKCGKTIERGGVAK